MALRERQYAGRSTVFVQMTKCPCGYEFSKGEYRSEHFLNDHTASDFGLSNRGDKA